MDQDTMVDVSLHGGWRLIDALEGQGFQLDVAFWARLSDEEKWILYLASPAVNPTVDNEGLRESYRHIHDVLRNSPEWGIDPFRVIVVGVEHPMAKAAANIVRPKVASGTFAAQSPRPYLGITRFNGRSLGGYYIDGAFIYPPWEPGLNPAF